MKIRHEVLVGRILHFYYLLPEKEQTASNFLQIRRSNANYYINNTRDVKEFIHKFREIKDSMKIRREDGLKTMEIVLNLFKSGECSGFISKKLDERDIILFNLRNQIILPISRENKDDQKESNFEILKDEIKKHFKRVKQKICPDQLHLDFTY